MYYEYRFNGKKFHLITLYCKFRDKKGTKIFAGQKNKS